MMEGTVIFLAFKLLGTMLIFYYYSPRIAITFALFEVLVAISCYLYFLVKNYFKRYISRKKLMYYSNNKEFKLIKMENKNKLTNSDIERLLKSSTKIDKSDFPNSNIRHPFIAGYRLELKGERFPFNIVVINKKDFAEL